MASNGYVQFDLAVIEQARQIDLFSYLQWYEPSNLKRWQAMSTAQGNTTA